MQTLLHTDIPCNASINNKVFPSTRLLHPNHAGRHRSTGLPRTHTLTSPAAHVAWVLLECQPSRF